ncbi:DUF1851 domain-containing protein [Microbacterium sp. cx-55]|uniref:T6SS immunity protein Tdi1 domain-containing protein n=1 Tax=Microbacterium sp. cx-55 TaxID=2875948 RepID=UPI001CBEEFF0|nr:T6SS immunity protein Tdi1 domain-containing protein [Microbacterium sp. cx-55]MBZ4488002.1 DUF1851 domain-containing protein [Microbacterium sp. cx-55]UGB34592.1 DUF1851 domain-containing protein [Microbacterium sp. cx-55]
MTDPLPNDPLKTLLPGEPAPPEVIERYRGVVPEELVNVWETHGFGTTVGGFVRFVDPRSLTDIVEETFERSAGAVPLFSTALGDIGVLRDGAVELLKYRRGRVDILTVRPARLLTYLGSPMRREHADYLDWNPYPQAVERLGIPLADECFGFTPLLVLGGPEDADHLTTVSLREHILFVTQVAGPLY